MHPVTSYSVIFDTPCQSHLQCDICHTMSVTYTVWYLTHPVTVHPVTSTVWYLTHPVSHIYSVIFDTPCQSHIQCDIWHTLSQSILSHLQYDVWHTLSQSAMWYLQYDVWHMWHLQCDVWHTMSHLQYDVWQTLSQSAMSHLQYDVWHMWHLQCDVWHPVTSIVWCLTHPVTLHNLISTVWCLTHPVTVHHVTSYSVMFDTPCHIYSMMFDTPCHIYSVMFDKCIWFGCPGMPDRLHILRALYGAPKQQQMVEIIIIVFKMKTFVIKIQPVFLYYSHQLRCWLYLCTQCMHFHLNCTKLPGNKLINEALIVMTIGYSYNRIGLVQH